MSYSGMSVSFWHDFLSLRYLRRVRSTRVASRYTKAEIGQDRSIDALIANNCRMMQNKIVTYKSIHDIPKPSSFNSNGPQGRLTTVQRSGHVWRTASGYFVPQTHNYIQRGKLNISII